MNRAHRLLAVTSASRFIRTLLAAAAVGLVAAASTAFAAGDVPKNETVVTARGSCFRYPERCKQPQGSPDPGLGGNKPGGGEGNSGRPSAGGSGNGAANSDCDTAASQAKSLGELLKKQGQTAEQLGKASQVLEMDIAGLERDLAKEKRAHAAVAAADQSTGRPALAAGGEALIACDEEGPKSQGCAAAKRRMREAQQRYRAAGTGPALYAAAAAEEDIRGKLNSFKAELSDKQAELVKLRTAIAGEMSQLTRLEKQCVR